MYGLFWECTSSLPTSIRDQILGKEPLGLLRRQDDLHIW
jgi:hypothetical protein